MFGITTVCTIPTAFRSPAISNSNYSWCITSNGEIGWEGWDSIAVKDSYGRLRSPYVYVEPGYYGAWYVRSDGVVDGNLVRNSYGNYIYNTSFRNTYSINPSKIINGQADYWWLRSPTDARDVDNVAYYVESDGFVNSSNYVWFNSYGISLSGI